MSHQRTKERGVITLSCGVQGCCPTVDFTDPQKIIIRDDFGGRVQLTPEQWSALKIQFAIPSDQD